MESLPNMDVLKLDSLDDLEKSDDLENELNFYVTLLTSGTHPQENTMQNAFLELSEKTYQNREELLECVRVTAMSHGCAVTIRRSKAEKYVIIGCDRGGTYRGSNVAPEKRKRRTTSRLINCPFQIIGRRKDDTWKVEIINLSHNHVLSNDISGHPYARRFSDEEYVQIKEMTKAGIPPRQILTSLRQKNSNMRAISKTLYNTRAKIIEEGLAGRTMIQALMEELSGGGFMYNVEYDNDGHLTHLFFAHPTAIALSKSYSNVFVMDCTYKTNKYQMPLLDIIGVSSFNTSFYSCFVFMQREETKDYMWALTMFKEMLGANNHPLVIVSDRELSLMNAIGVVFPEATNLLCVWHIEKNIVTNCQRHFEKASDWEMFISTWTDLINSPDEESFIESWQIFEKQYEAYASMTNYIRNTWLPYREKFVSAWTEKHSHFGNRVTSRAEGAHANLKRYLQVSNSDLRIVKDKICHAIENQFQEIKVKLSSERMRVPHKFLNIPYFRNVVTCVSVHALEELFKQYVLAFSDSLLPVCKGHFSKTMGLPCAHIMKESGREVLELSDVHSQWRIDGILFSNIGNREVDEQEEQWAELVKELESKYKQLPLTQKESVRKQISHFVNAPAPLILEPKILPHKGSSQYSRKRKNTTSTRRDPSSFEIIEKTRKCSICKNGGHDSRTCPKNPKNAEKSSSQTEKETMTDTDPLANSSMVSVFRRVTLHVNDEVGHDELTHMQGCILKE